MGAGPIIGIIFGALIAICLLAWICSACRNYDGEPGSTVVITETYAVEQPMPNFSVQANYQPPVGSMYPAPNQVNYAFPAHEKPPEYARY